MSAPPMDDSPRPPSYRDLLVERAERPRATRPTLRGIVDFCASVVVTGGFAVVLGTRLCEKWAQSRSTSGFQRAVWFWLVLVLVTLGLALPLVVRTRRRERNLVKNGNVAIASVLSQTMHARSGSWVTYDFKDAHGTRYQGACTDKAKELFKGMSFLVFYEPGLPTRRVASCESNFEVVLPNEE
jgi:hypothetical protein